MINIVTKGPDWERHGGALTASIGKRATADATLEPGGASGNLGYYAAGGTLTAGVAGVNNHHGQDEGLLAGAWPVHDDADRRQGSLSLKYARPLAPRLLLDLDGYVLSRRGETKFNDRIDGVNIPFQYTRSTESSRNAGVRLTWGDRGNRLVAGAEYGHDAFRSEQVAPTASEWGRFDWDRWAAYANGTVAVGRVTILPGLRHDRTGLSGSYTSSTLGATWQATPKTLLRAYAARSFATPRPLSATQERMLGRTFQAGFETEQLPSLWVKGTYFYNRLFDVARLGTSPNNHQARQGFEIEAYTAPWFGLSLTAGYTLTDARDADTKVRLETDSGQTVSPHLIKVGLLYDDRYLGLRGALNGNYVQWNEAPGYPSTSRGAVWDLHLSWKARPADELPPELFFSGRNLFSNEQSMRTDLFPNTPVWFEGGFRWSF